MKKFYDIVFVGGGLANGLAAYRLKHTRPDVEFLVLEQQPHFGGNHTWCFHETDLTPLEWSWVAPLVSKTWEATEVQFPHLRRVLPQRYHAIRSEHWNEILSRELVYQGRGQKAVDVSPTQVVLEDGTSVQASCVVDGRGWNASTSVREGFQKFYGMDVQLKKPHGLSYPILMDATVPQEDGYRFVYLLPWDPTRVLVEDTYYSDNPFLDTKQIRDKLMAYLQQRDWIVQDVEREEHGILSIPMEGCIQAWEDGVVLSGTRGGFFHATTGYSLPTAVRFADAFAHLETFEARRVFKAVRTWADGHWKEQAFFRRLNRMMFRACAPGQRYRILENFYHHPESIISKFYAGHLSLLDKVRMFASTPPVPLVAALNCVWEKKRI